MTFLFIIALIALAVSLWLNAKAFERIHDLERWNTHFGHRVDEAFNKANRAVQETQKSEAYYDKQAERILTEFNMTKGLVSSIQSRVDKNAALCEDDKKSLMLLADKVETQARDILFLKEIGKPKPQPQTRSRSRSRRKV